MEQHRERENMKLILRFSLLAIIVIVGACILATSCCVCSQTSEQINYRDSTVVHIKDSTAVRDSVVYVHIPVESSQNILPEFVPSHLETSFAESDAWVDSLGLHHTIQNKSKPIEVHVPVTEHFTETTTDHEKEETHIITQEVERSFTWWEKVRLRGFWWLLGAVILLMAYIFRKPIIGLIKKLL